jgi:hypothetical protein
MIGAEGVEPAGPYGQRILSPLKSALPSLIKRYEPVFTGLAVVKVSRFVWLRINTSRHHLSPIFESQKKLSDVLRIFIARMSPLIWTRSLLKEIHLKISLRTTGPHSWQAIH